VSPLTGAAGGRRSRAEEESLLRRYRVVIAKPGLDGHDRGAKVIARALRDAGFEVVYTGLFQTPVQVVEAVLQEDADALGLSVLSGAHMTLIPAVVERLRAVGLDNVLVFAGGIIPDADRAPLLETGVAQVFTPGAALREVTDWLESALDARHGAASGAG
jgi:methylmalonyl-CoA mutase, C-terminal domain